jgi:dimeric dUTPase (all-alpha-NTP-PPase superfamily)
MIFITIISFILSVVLGFTTWNLLRKIEVYEQNLEQFYSAIAITLATMRQLDEKQMFETDDEVGTLFQQLVDILSNLRPILYGMEPNDNNEKN